MTSGEGDSIRVYVRVRPPDESDIDLGRRCVSVTSPTTIDLLSNPNPKTFVYDKVADTNVTQDEVFSTVGRSIVESCVAGYNGTIFAYGQTGSGKTFTMLGPAENSDNFNHRLRGVVPRCFEYLFHQILKEKDVHGDQLEFFCRCSFLEIYNEHIYDLLDPTSPMLALRENVHSGVFVEGCSEIAVDSASQAYEVLARGWVNRKVASTSMNRESSRSHAVFTLLIESKEKKEGMTNIRVSSLNLVDLAGSERQKDTHTAGIRLKEAGSINKSLSVLGQVIKCLVDVMHGKSRFVPYRDSKLTFLLRDSLGGNAKTYIIANVHPGSRFFGETLSTLDFAKRAKMIKNKAIINEDTQGSVIKLQEEIKRLKDVISNLKTAPGSKSIATIDNDVALISTDSNWKRLFMEAMVLNEEKNTQFSEFDQKIEKLKQISNFKDKCVQSTKMIVKFRDSYIKKLETAKKNPESVIEDDGTMNDLKKELSLLKDQVNNHPMVAKFALEVVNLNNKIRYLVSQKTVRDNMAMEEERETALQNLFDKLKLETADSNRISCFKNDHTKRDSLTNLSTPTGRTSQAIVDKYKLQVGQLKTDRDKMKEDLDSVREELKTKQTNFEGHIAWLEKTKTELKNALEASKLQSRLEKDAMSDFHVTMIKTFTTPTKTSPGRSQCLSGQSPLGSFSLNDSIEHGETLLDIQPPQLMTEQHNEALLEELQHILNLNKQLNNQIQNMQNEMKKLTESNSFLECQNKSLQETLSCEKTNRHQVVKELNTQIDSLRDDLQERIDILSLHRSEADDLKIILKSTDKQLIEAKKQHQEHSVAIEQRCVILESKKLELTVNLRDSEERLDKANEQILRQQESLENFEEEVMFKENEISTLQSELLNTRESLQHKCNEIQTLSERLQSETEYNHQLLNQLKDGGSKQEELLEALQTIDELKLLNTQLGQELHDKNESNHNLRSQVEMSQSENESFKDELQRNRVAVAGFMTTINTLRQTSESTISEITSNISDLTTDKKSLETKIIEQATYIDELIQDSDKMNDKIQSLEASNNVEVEMMREDIEFHVGQNLILTEQVESQNSELKVCRSELDVKSNEIIDLVEQVKKEQCLNTETENSYEIKVKELETKLLRESGHRNPEDIVNQYESEIAILKNDQRKLSDLLSSYETQRTEKNQLIESLNAQVNAQMCEIEKTVSEKLLIGTENNELLDKMNILEQNLSEIEDYHSQRLSALKTVESGLKDDVCKFKQMFDEMKVESEKYKETSEEKETRMVDLSCKVQHLTCELQSLEEKLFIKSENLKTQITKLTDEKTEINEKFEKLEQQNEILTIENAKLVSHNNPKQKIHLHLMLKKELYDIKDKFQLLSDENLKKDNEIQRLSFQLTGHDSHKLVENLPLTDKENCKPN